MTQGDHVSLQKAVAEEEEELVTSEQAGYTEAKVVAWDAR